MGHLANQHYKFEGKERDTETGLDNFGARFSNSNMGRFMSPDWANKPEPVPYAKTTSPQSLNLYAFAGNNPESGPDLDGHFMTLAQYHEPVEVGAGNLQTNFGDMPPSTSTTAAPTTQSGSTTQSSSNAQTQPLTAQQMTNAQNAAMSDPNLQPGAHGAASHCSEATCQIAHAVGANTAPLGPSSGGFYRANQQVENLAQAALTPGTGWHATDLGSAQQLANQGQLVIIGWINPSGGSGHTVTVMSDPNNPRAATNPTVAQVGGSTGNGRMPFRNAFGADKRGQVQIYVYTGH